LSSWPIITPLIHKREFKYYKLSLLIGGDRVWWVYGGGYQDEVVVEE
jgi:hypothetical protein